MKVVKDRKCAYQGCENRIPFIVPGWYCSEHKDQAPLEVST